ncbi:hypothetical protein RhiirA4_472805 [Rhizophagus irregularis]|uniref:Uncharacterized protein n=1 Tax=Rhizophagus irregularis TaxID=588596 RepID=A0A2I1H5K7_9GLOM|nr:hypothetical protein RhiirA4_472805 [Rhizophagus irregularis]
MDVWYSLRVRLILPRYTSRYNMNAFAELYYMKMAEAFIFLDISWVWYSLRVRLILLRYVLEYDMKPSSELLYKKLEEGYTFPRYVSGDIQGILLQNLYIK